MIDYYKVILKVLEDQDVHNADYIARSINQAIDEHCKRNPSKKS